MKNGNIDITYYKPTELIAAEYNPRQLTKDQHKDLTDSIKRFGLVDPLIVNTHKERKNVLIGGHQRLKIATMLGLKEIPCVEVELNPAKEKELNIRLNKNVGEWDWDALANYFDVGELTEWGFTDDELQFYEDEPTEGLIDDDEVPEVEEAITKQGDLWLLGEHRLLCGDATKKEDVERLMDGQKADMVFTDPPYGIDIGNQSQGKGGGIAKKIDYGTNEWDKKVPISGIQIALSFGREAFLWGGNHFCDILPISSGWVVWDKENGKTDFSDCELAWTSLQKATKLYKWKWRGMIQKDMTNKEKRYHPTQKPVGLFVDIFNDVEFITCLDPFLGSGSTLIACEKTNRKCYGMEIDPHYCDVIVKRWEEYTGNKAERIEAASA